MKFLTVAEKLKSTRKYLKMKQEDLADEDFTRGLVSMIEIGRRDLNPVIARKITAKFQQKAQELGMELKIDENFLLRSPAEDAELYCIKKIEKNNIENDIKEIFQIADKFNLLRVKAKAYAKLGDSSFDKKDYINAFSNYNQSVAILKNINDNELTPYLFWKIGLCKLKSLQYEDALTYFEICENYSVIYDDKKIQQLVLYDKALCCRKINKLDLAVETIDKYLGFKNTNDNPDFYIYANILKANCHDDMSEYDAAIEIYNNLILQISEKNNPLLGLLYCNLGLVYLNKSDFAASQYYFEKSEQLRSSFDKLNLSHTLIEKSELFLKQHLDAEAIRTIKSGLSEAEIYNDYEYLLKGNNKLAGIYENLKDTENLKDVYLTISKLLKIAKDFNGLTSVYVKLALLYLDENNTDMVKKYLKMSQKGDA